MKKYFQTLWFYLHIRRLYGRFFGPRVFVASIPKSGTHLLIRSLLLLPYLRLGKVRYYEDAKAGHIVQTHDPPDPQFVAAVESQKFKVLFILRDPRAICLSFYHWAMRIDESNPFYAYFAALPDDNARLTAAISGMNVDEAYGKELAKKHDLFLWRGINQEVRRMLPWRDCQRCLTVTFEDLVGQKGGGDDQLQREEIQKISHHLQLKLTRKDIDYVAANLFGNSLTFRRGKIDEWRSVFNEDHVDLFKREAGDLLIELGYERDYNW